MATRMRFKKNGKPRRGVSHRYQKCLEKSRFPAIRKGIRCLYSTLQLLEPTAGSLHIGDQRRSSLKAA